MASSSEDAGISIACGLRGCIVHLPDDKMFLSATGTVHVDTLPDRAEVSYERAMVEGRPCFLGLCGCLLQWYASHCRALGLPDTGWPFIRCHSAGDEDSVRG